MGKEYIICANVTVSVYTKVIANSIEDAKIIAEDRTPMQVINDGSNDEYEEWMLEEIDGTPFDLREE